VGAQTVKLSTVDAKELASELASVLDALHSKIFARDKPKT
jgi:hypothetical protein